MDAYIEPWLKAAREAKKAALKNETSSLFIQPLFDDAPRLILQYDDLQLNAESLTDKDISLCVKSGVPLSLVTDKYPSWGGFHPKRLYVEGRIVKSRVQNKRRFIATKVHVKNKPIHNQITSIHLLYSRGFYTPLLLCSWMSTKDITAASLRSRLVEVNKKRIRRDGKYFSPMPASGLELFDYHLK